MKYTRREVIFSLGSMRKPVRKRGPRIIRRCILSRLSLLWTAFERLAIELHASKNTSVRASRYASNAPRVRDTYEIRPGPSFLTPFLNERIELSDYQFVLETKRDSFNNFAHFLSLGTIRVQLPPTTSSVSSTTRFNVLPVRLSLDQPFDETFRDNFSRM